MAQRIHQRLKHTLLGLINRPFVSRELAGAQRPLILHMSDTPRLSFPFVLRVVETLQPEYIVHTGDVVDDIKLEARPQEHGAYRRQLGEFLHRLEAVSRGEIYLVPGNHDDAQVMREASRRATTVAPGTILELEGVKLSVSHHYDEDADHGDFCLYGHTPEPDHHHRGEMMCLNGISTVTIIEVPTRTVHFLPYPSGTDQVRKALLPKPGL
jgi:predicted phosphodiesterase